MSDLFSREYLAMLPQETPFFVVSKQRLAEKYQEFRDLFPSATVHYAVKANAESQVLATLAGLGSSFEVASKYELEMLKPHRVGPERIIYGNSVKPAEHIKEFASYGVDRFACDSFPEVEKLAAAAPNAQVCVRMTVDDTGSVFRLSEKFGTDRATVAAILIRARELGLHPYGIAFHVGSQASNPVAWAHGIEQAGSVMEELATFGIRLDALNLGGGFPCAYASTEPTPSLQEIAAHTLGALAALPYQPSIILEPGRGLVAESAVLVATIIGRVERREHTWLFLDAGVYNGLFETMAYQGSTRYKVTSVRASFASGETCFALAGPTGDSPDVISRETLLPSDIGVGDRLVFHDVGAYSLTAVCPFFNGFPKPQVVYEDDGVMAAEVG